jgi:hypothetical protein
MCVGSLVKYKNTGSSYRKGLVLEVKGKKWVKVLWTAQEKLGGLIFLEHVEDLVFI